MKIDISTIPENKTFDDYPKGTTFVHKEHSPRYILEPIYSYTKIFIINHIIV